MKIYKYCSSNQIKEPNNEKTQHFGNEKRYLKITTDLKIELIVPVPNGLLNLSRKSTNFFSSPHALVDN